MSRADKFFNTNLDQILKDHGAQTLLAVGSAANGAVLYTTFGAVERGYTVAVATDGISSGSDFDTYLAQIKPDDARAPAALGALLLDLDMPVDAIPYLLHKRKHAQGRHRFAN